MWHMVQWLVELVSSLGYLGIFLLMMVESSFIPFPSEVVMVPAGFLAYKGEMNLAIVIGLGILGSLCGAYINYFLAWYVGRPFLKKFGRYFFMSEEKLLYVDVFFKKHGAFSTFFGRLIPMVRQLVSIPAGITRMNLLKFSFYTGLGAGIWVTVLALLGYFVGYNEALVQEYIHMITLSMLGIIVVSVLIYRKWRR
jgi:membrane protein DedA with SNARE-associated domain